MIIIKCFIFYYLLSFGCIWLFVTFYSAVIYCLVSPTGESREQALSWGWLVLWLPPLVKDWIHEPHSQLVLSRAEPSRKLLDQHFILRNSLKILNKIIKRFALPNVFVYTPIAYNLIVFKPGMLDGVLEEEEATELHFTNKLALPKQNNQINCMQNNCASVSICHCLFTALVTHRQPPFPTRLNQFGYFYQWTSS